MENSCFCGAAFATAGQLHQHAQSRGHRFRYSCGSLFKALESIQQHQHDKKHTAPTYHVEHPSFTDQTAALPNTTARIACRLCHKTFRGSDGLDGHVRNKHDTCPTCGQAFASAEQLTGHQVAAGHCYCHEHDLVFRGGTELRMHKSAEPHVTGFECLICDRGFTTQQGLDDHLQDKDHPAVDTEEFSAAAEAAKAAAEEANLYCEACERPFQHIEAYRQHKNSVKHKPLSDLQCPLSTGCGKTFTSPSALILHLESGGCVSGMNRLRLNAVIHQHDTGRHITYEENAPAAISAAASVDSLTSMMDGMSVTSGVVVETPDESDTASVASDGSGVLLTPSAMTSRSRASSVGGVVLTPSGTSQALSEWSYITNGNGMTPASTSLAGSTADTITHDNPDGTWPCTICSKTFKKNTSLLLHLNSPVHATKDFHCPTALVGLHGGKGSKAFKTLSGMAQHIEIGACAGGKETLDLIVSIFESRIKLATGQNVKLLRASA
ncbi:hypothetical protein LTR36_004391 [Oleoguttula mirabilis]|uniref:C2H2-type domain-containing protein n=1 Tax=Oleoguttula mirabilis TaxID=1507867 RepID=A0AAV9JGW5_9PEZI|nr:hypothetical protein LTR36_004391 [Oleoguttula mirabilis]